MPSWSGVFLFGTFLSVTFSESNCTFASGPSSSPWNSQMLFTYSTIRYFANACFVCIADLVFFGCIFRLIYRGIFRFFHSIASFGIFPSLVLLLILAVSLFVLLTLFPIQLLYFCSGSFLGYQFYH